MLHVRINPQNAYHYGDGMGDGLEQHIRVWTISRSPNYYGHGDFGDQEGGGKGLFSHLFHYSMADAVISALTCVKEP